VSIYSKSNAYAHAIAMVTAGLSSGSIKLEGPDKQGAYGKSDAKYLADLIAGIVDSLQDPAHKADKDIHKGV